MNPNCDQARDVPTASHKWLLLLATGLIGLLLIFRAHFAVFLVKGESMLPGLRSGDLVLVDKLAYPEKPPQRGDIVVARESNDLIIKRVVSLPGEAVELRRGKLYVNELPLAEDYAIEPGWMSVGRGRLRENKFALLGDNRSVSSSVFVHAVVAGEQILGKVIYSVRLWPG